MSRPHFPEYLYLTRTREAEGDRQIQVLTVREVAGCYGPRILAKRSDNRGLLKCPIAVAQQHSYARADAGVVVLVRSSDIELSIAVEIADDHTVRPRRCRIVYGGLEGPVTVADQHGHAVIADVIRTCAVNYDKIDITVSVEVGRNQRAGS
jgi:hypothetical protein